MKKTIIMLLAAMLALFMLGCTAKTNAADTPANDQLATVGGADAPAEGLKTVEEGMLIIALSPDFSPMEFVDTTKSGQEQFVGFDVTLSKYLADGLGLELEIRPMSFDACQTAVQMGAVDMSVSGFS